MSFIQVLSELTLSQLPTIVGGLRVLTILGKARMGKSTFLNAIVQYCAHTTIPFQTSDSMDHCTRGIDTYFIPEQNLLLLDCQGLSLEDSSHDPALLLFAYMVSDVLVVNERMMLQNEALKLLEPICTFRSYVDAAAKKPLLWFRISDGDMVTDVAQNLSKVMTDYKDQYQTIRESLRCLFADIRIMKTESLDRIVKQQLAVGNYKALLVPGMYGFQEAISELLRSLPSPHSSQEWTDSIEPLLHKINYNTKISIEKLDIVGKTAQVDILEWMTALDTTLFAPIPGNAKQSVYAAQVLPRMAKVASVLEEFDNTFAYTPTSIRDAHQKDLKSRLEDPLSAAKRDFEQCARESIAGLVAQAFGTQTYTATSAGGDLNMPAMPPFAALRTALEDLYAPVAQEYAEKMVAVEQQITEALQECFRVDSTVAEQRTASLEKLCSNIETHMVVEENADFLVRPVEETVGLLATEAMKTMGEFAQIHTVQIHCKESVFIVKVEREVVGNVEAIEKYAHVKRVYEEMKEVVLKCMLEKKKLLMEKKEGMLYGKEFRNAPNWGKLIQHWLPEQYRENYYISGHINNNIILAIPKDSEFVTKYCTTQHYINRDCTATLHYINRDFIIPEHGITVDTILQNGIQGLDSLPEYVANKMKEHFTEVEKTPKLPSGSVYGKKTINGVCLTCNCTPYLPFDCTGSCRKLFMSVIGKILNEYSQIYKQSYIKEINECFKHSVILIKGNIREDNTYIDSMVKCNDPLYHKKLCYKDWGLTFASYKPAITNHCEYTREIPHVTFVCINDFLVTKRTFDATYQLALDQTLQRMKEKEYPTDKPYYTLEQKDGHWTFEWTKPERSYDASAHHVFQHIFHKYMAKMPLKAGDFKDFGEPVICKEYS